MSETENRNHIDYGENIRLAPCGGLLLDKASLEIVEVDGYQVLKSTGGTSTPATYTDLGSVIIGAGISVTPEGVISTNLPQIVGTVTNGSVFPTVRPSGQPLINGDWVQPAPDATFPFTVGTVTFESSTDQATYIDGDWVPQKAKLPKTNEVTLTLPAVEKYEEERDTQYSLNLDMLQAIKDSIIYVDDITAVPAEKLYKRLYYQTADTASYRSGIWWYDFTDDTWKRFHQVTVEVGLSEPADESWEEERSEQSSINKDIMEQLRSIIIEYPDLNAVPGDKLYKRLYRQLNNTTDRLAGLYYRDFDTNTWIPLDGDTARVALNDPNGVEKWEDLDNKTQLQLNATVLEELRKIIIEYDNLNDVPATKLYRRLYHQMTDTADRDAGIYYYDFATNKWIPFEQDTATVALNDPATEIWEVERETQQEFNRDLSWNLKNIILWNSDLDLVEDAKKYKRLYYQTVDTVARKQGLYYYDFAINEWVALDGNTERTPLTDPAGVEKFEVELTNQKELNETFITEIKNFIRYAEDLDAVDIDKRYKRIYKQTEDTALRKAGYYAWDVDKNDWVSVGGGNTETVMLTDVELESMSLDDATQKDVNETNKKIISRMLYMPVFSRVEPWLYEADYKNAQVDEVFARDYINSHDGKLSEPGACTAVYNNGYFAKNFDWNFDNSEAIVCKILGGFYDVMGTTSGINALSKDYCEHLLADKTEWNDVLRALPYYLNEGQNSANLFVGLNIVPANEILEGNPTIPTTGTNPAVSTRTSALMIPSLILQNCGSASEAKTYINNLNIYCPDGSEVHLMIGDGSGALWLLEFINNGVVWTDMTAANKAPYMTNYYQTYAVYGSDKKLVDHNHIGEHPNGVHRGDLVAENLSSIASVDSALDFLQTTVKYTNTYIDSTDWIDEFCSNTPEFGDLTIAMADTNPSAFSAIIAWARNQYAIRSRDTGTTWQTVFSAVNDINAKKMYVVVQEQGIAYQHMFELDDTPIESDHHILVDELPTSDIEQKNLYLVKDETEVGKIDTVAKYDGANWWTAAVNNNGIGVGEVFPPDPYLNQVFIISYDD